MDFLDAPVTGHLLSLLDILTSCSLNIINIKYYVIIIINWWGKNILSFFCQAIAANTEKI
jgi:hypothetical protein